MEFRFYGACCIAHITKVNNSLCNEKCNHEDGYKVWHYRDLLLVAKKHFCEKYINNKEIMKDRMRKYYENSIEIIKDKEIRVILELPDYGLFLISVKQQPIVEGYLKGLYERTIDKLVSENETKLNLKSAEVQHRLINDKEHNKHLKDFIILATRQINLDIQAIDYSKFFSLQTLSKRSPHN